MISASTSDAAQQVEVMDRHVRALEARLARPVWGRTHWVRGPLLDMVVSKRGTGTSKTRSQSPFLKQRVKLPEPFPAASGDGARDEVASDPVAAPAQ